MIDINAIKNIYPEIIFDALGIPYKPQGRGYIFRCIWREDKNPSGWCEYGNDAWVWVDYATGEGGSWIDLVMKIENCDVKEAIHKLSEFDFKCNTFHSYKESKCNTETTQIIKVFDAKYSNVIKDFLKTWGIVYIPAWLKAVRFTLREKSLFGFGIRNIKGGWHVRLCLHNPVVKEYCLSINVPAVLTEYDNYNQVVIVEGMKDALFIWQWLFFNKIDDIAIISLNGIGNWKKALKIIKNLQITAVYTALDNDIPGKETEQKLVNGLKSTPIKIYRLEYQGKDPAEAKDGFNILEVNNEKQGSKRKTLRRGI